MKIQVGANDGETITIDLKKIDSDTLNLAGFNVNGKGSVANTAATSDDLKLAGFTKGTTDTNGVTAYTNTISNDKAKASDLLANITDGSVITGEGQTLLAWLQRMVTPMMQQVNLIVLLQMVPIQRRR